MFSMELGGKICSNRKTYNCDRFIPARSSINLDFAQAMLTGGARKPAASSSSSFSQAYQMRLRECCFQNRTRILDFSNGDRKNDAPTAFVGEEAQDLLCRKPKSVKERRIPRRPKLTLSVPSLSNDYYLNLMDWSNQNVIAVALDDTVYLWDYTMRSMTSWFSGNALDGPVTSVSWAPDGKRLAVGFSNSHVKLWDTAAGRLETTIAGSHGSRVGALAWKHHILTSGGRDGRVVNNDVRVKSRAVQTYRGHSGEVCGLRWVDFGWQFASGGDDDLVHIWDMSMASSTNNRKQWLHRFDEHKAAVKALAWCPSRRNLLASGGGTHDRCIKFWNVNTGSSVDSIDTGSQVSALFWNKKGDELLSSHGFRQNQLSLWKYPKMDKMADFLGHTERVLFMAQSPDGCTVASAGPDETLQLWSIFADSGSRKSPERPAREMPFSSFAQIR